MGIKQIGANNFMVSYHKRHPITRKPVSLVRSKNIKTRAQAEKVYKQLIIEVEESIRKKITPTWGKALTDYFLEQRNSGLTNTTLYNRQKVLNAYTMKEWGAILVDEISTDNIRQLLEREFGGKSETHKKFFLSCVRYVFQYAQEKEFIIRNPTPTIRFKVRDKIKSVLSENQVKDLLRKAQEEDWPWYPHYAVALFTGLRNGELYALTWDKVDLERKQILVNVSWNNKDGFKSTKSGDDRLVEIPNPLMPILRELKIQAGEQVFVLPRIPKWDKGEQARELRLFLTMVGLPRIRFHDLRATWATMLLAKGVAPSKVMAMGGWKDMKTMLIYMRKSGIDIKGSTDVLDGMHTHGINHAEVVPIRKM